MKLKFNTEKLFIVILLLLVSTKAISQIDPGVDFDLNGNINDRLDQGQTESKRFSTAGFYSVDDSPRKVFNFNPGRILSEDIGCG